MGERDGKTSRRPLSLRWLAELYFSEGHEVAKNVFEATVSKSAVRLYSIVKAGQGRAEFRTDAEIADGITYKNFGPPDFWEPKYSVFYVEFENVVKEDYMFHAGEELLLPTAGEIVYSFYSTKGRGLPQRFLLEPSVKPGALIQINPQVPHHTWAKSENRAEAWMIFRSLRQTPTAISVDSGHYPRIHPIHHAPRRVNSKDLEDPGRYALIAWGLAEKIGLHRQLADLTVAELARACEIDPSFISRIESADANVSLETLLRIARFLRIGLADLIAPQPWCHQLVQLAESNSTDEEGSYQPLLKAPDVEHFLHPVQWIVPSGITMKSDFPSPHGGMQTQGTMQSWIVLQGRLIFEIPAGTSPGPSTTCELVERGDVIHFRQAAPRSIQALQTAQLLQFVYSTQCACARPANK